MNLSHPPNRLSSFSRRAALKWPFTISKKTSNSTIHPQHLSNAGFHHTPATNHPARTTCYLCELVIDDWNEGDDPIERHLAEAGETGCGWALYAKLKQEWDGGKLKPVKEWEKCWGSSGQWWPKSDTMEAIRRNTFEAGWPHAQARNMPTIEAIVSAGWFFTPSEGEDEDCVSCPYCHRSVSVWESDDNPIAQHNRKAGAKCPFFKAPPPKALAAEAVAAPPSRRNTAPVTKPAPLPPPSRAFKNAKPDEPDEEDEDEQVGEESDESGGIRLVESRGATPVKGVRKGVAATKKPALIAPDDSLVIKVGKKALSEKEGRRKEEKEEDSEEPIHQSQPSIPPTTRPRRGTNASETSFSIASVAAPKTSTRATTKIVSPPPSSVFSPPTRSTRAASSMSVASPPPPAPPASKPTRGAKANPTAVVPSAVVEQEIELEPVIEPEPEVVEQRPIEVDVPFVAHKERAEEVRMEVEEESDTTANSIQPDPAKKSKAKAKSKKVGSKKPLVVVHEDQPADPFALSPSRPAQSLDPTSPFASKPPPSPNPFEVLGVSTNAITSEERKMTVEEFLDMKGKEVVARAREEADKAMSETKMRVEEGRRRLVEMIERKTREVAASGAAR